MQSFILLKSYFPSLSHSNLTSFLSNLCMGFINPAKLGMNLLMKLICPLNDYKAFLFWGKGTFFMASSLSGSIFTPSLEIMCLSNLPSSIPKTDLAGFKEMPNLLHLSNTFLRWPIWSDLSLEKKIRSS